MDDNIYNSCPWSEDITLAFLLADYRETEQRSVLTHFFEKLIERQQPLDPEFVAIVDKNFSKLLA